MDIRILSFCILIKTLFTMNTKFLTPLLPLLFLSRHVLSLPSNSDSWHLLPPIPLGPQQEESVAAIGGDIYIVGGINLVPPNATTIPSVSYMQVYSTTTNTWRRVADIPMAVNHANMASLNGKLYVLGAIAGSGVNYPIANSFAYTPATDTWDALPPMPAGTERGAAGVGVWGDNIVIAGGLNYTDFLNGAQTTVPWTSMFNTRTLQWDTAFPDLPDGGRDHCGGVVLGDTFYVVGGRVSGERNVRGTVWAMDLGNATRTWVEMEGKMPTPRGSHSTALVDGKIYTFGGEGNPVGNGIFNNVEVYDVKADSWEVLAPMPEPRHGTAAAVVDGRVYIPGGAYKGGAGAVDSNQMFIP
ncbi:kelch domain-containing protein [Colletotrichum graminicola]|nr:kelch domain-containing protein [Colletotrichum graminicola]